MLKSDDEQSKNFFIYILMWLCVDSYQPRCIIILDGVSSITAFGCGSWLQRVSVPSNRPRGGVLEPRCYAPGCQRKSSRAVAGKLFFEFFTLTSAAPALCLASVGTQQRSFFIRDAAAMNWVELRTSTLHCRSCFQDFFLINLLDFWLLLQTCIRRYVY